MSKSDEQPISCSFCGKSEAQARLIAGPGVYICSECVDACCDLLQDAECQENAPIDAAVAVAPKAEEAASEE